MAKKNFFVERDEEMKKLAQRYETAQSENRPLYLDADECADLADWYAVNRDYNMAKDVACYGLTLHPDDTGLLVEAAYIYMDTGDLDAADLLIAQLYEETSEVIILKANMLMKQGRIQKADMLIKTLEDKDSLANIIDITYLYLDAGYPEKAKEYLKLGKGLYDEKEPYIAAKADYYSAMRQFASAKRYYNKLIDINPYSAPYWYGLAHCYFEEENFAKAIEACDYALVGDENFTDAYALRGQAYYQVGNEEKALEDLKKADPRGIRLPGFTEFVSGVAEMTECNWEEALGHFKKVLEDGNYDEVVTTAQLYTDIALCYHKLGQSEEAHYCLKKAHAAELFAPDTYLTEGRIYIEEGKPRKGHEAWNKAVEYAPFADTWQSIGMTSLELGDPKYAQKAFKEMKKLDPNFRSVNELLTCASLLAGDMTAFQKYNKECTRPINEKELALIQEALKATSGRKNLLNSLKAIVSILLDDENYHL